MTATTATTVATSITPSANHASDAPAGRYRRVKGPTLTIPAPPRLRRGHQPRTSRSDDRRPGAQMAMTGTASLVAAAPTVARKPVPLAEAMAETRRYVDSSAGPDRARDIDRLRAEVAQSADLVKYLTQVHDELTRAGHADGSPAANCSGMAANIRPEQARWRRAEKALRDAEMAQQSRQAWLDEHPETVHHLDGLRARARGQARRRPGA